MASGTKTMDPDKSTAAPYVVRTKLRPPHIREGLLERPNLIQTLRSGRERTLTLVCAPAGYGKSTLLAQWAAMDADRTPFAWVSLDPMDSDPARLWGHVITALQDVHGPVGQRSLKAFAAGPRAIAEIGLPLLVDELSECPPVVLVLEDWHTAESPVCDETVGVFLDRAPSTVQVVISSRHDPSVHVARLRAHGDLTELRARDLSVSFIEADALLRDYDVRLTDREVRKLTARTEGWLAGLCLAAIVLREQVDIRRFVDEFSGDARDIFDYLAGDVLAAADPDLRVFMARSSVLERLSAPLCDVVLERSDSASMLAEIERSNFFLVPLDATGTDYRYHYLFADVLRRQLETNDPEVVPGLHARASLWFEEHGEIERAIDHAIASGDLARSSALVLREGVSLLSAGRMTTLNRWLDSLSWPEARADRELAIMRGLTARLSGQGRDEVERWLRVAEDGPDYGPLANGIASIRSAVAMVSSTYLSRGIADAERSATLVLENEPAESEWRYAGLVPLGQGLFLAGRPEEARAPLEEARTLPGARHRATSILALAYLSLIELAGGDAERSEQLARDALALAVELGHLSSAAGANAHLALGCALMSGADLHAAIEHLERAVEYAGDDADEASYWHAHANIHLAAARHRLGDSGAAKDALSRARAELDELPDVGILGDLYRQTDDALHHRARHEGFLGDELSEAERRVLDLLLEGLSVSDVARELWLSPNTVKTHRRIIYRKLGATTREEMIERAGHAGIAEPAAGDAHPE
jgi:ATP/maltotriose-dependent transcriptional regulator MalT